MIDAPAAALRDGSDDSAAVIGRAGVLEAPSAAFEHSAQRVHAVAAPAAVDERFAALRAAHAVEQVLAAVQPVAAQVADRVQRAAASAPDAFNAAVAAFGDCPTGVFEPAPVEAGSESAEVDALVHTITAKLTDVEAAKALAVVEAIAAICADLFEKS